MAKNIDIRQNFIHSDVFNKGIETTLVKGEIFLMLFSSSDGEILASTSDIGSAGANKLEWERDSGNNGGTLKINTIPASYTKDYVTGSGNQKEAQYFTLATCSLKTEAQSGGIVESNGGTPEHAFPDLDSGNVVPLVVGKLANAVPITEETNFQFNASTITFKVEEV